MVLKGTFLKCRCFVYRKGSFFPLAALERDNLHCRMSNVPSPPAAHVTDAGLPIGECVVGKEAKEARGPSSEEQPR